MSPIERHGKAVLQFSGGKDSLACLYLLKPYWDRLTLLWVNTGAAFPETVEQMARIAKLVRLVEVKSDQPGNIARMGPPSDVVPLRATPYGRWATQSHEPPIQSALDCCSANLWQPMTLAVKDSGATLVIRGQRTADKDKSPLRSGAVVGGVEYWFPLEDWSEHDVRSYLAEIGVTLPAHYEYVNSSLDCWSCTAYRDHVVGRMRYMRKRHPELHEKVIPLLERIRDCVQHELSFVEEALHG